MLEDGHGKTFQMGFASQFVLVAAVAQAQRGAQAQEGADSGCARCVRSLGSWQVDRCFGLDQGVCPLADASCCRRILTEAEVERNGMPAAWVGEAHAIECCESVEAAAVEGQTTTLSSLWFAEAEQAAAAEAPNACRSPRDGVAGDCDRCCDPDEREGCAYHAWTGGRGFASVTPWYNMAGIEWGKRCADAFPGGCRPCARCKLRDLEDFGALRVPELACRNASAACAAAASEPTPATGGADGSAAAAGEEKEEEAEEAAFDIDPCFDPTSCGCFCERWTAAVEACPSLRAHSVPLSSFAADDESGSEGRGPTAASRFHRTAPHGAAAASSHRAADRSTSRTAPHRARRDDADAARGASSVGSVGLRHHAHE